MRLDGDESSCSKTVEWHDPRPTMAERVQLSGIDAISKILTGDLPKAPADILFGLIGGEAKAGQVTLHARPDSSHLNYGGVVAASFAAHWLDMSMAWAVFSDLPKGITCTTIQLDTKLTRPIVLRDDPELNTYTAKGKTVTVGKSLATAESYLEGVDGKLYAHATSSWAVVSVERFKA